MTLADLGFRDGVTFRQLAGRQTVYFPVPSGATFDTMELRLILRAGSTTPADRYLQVSAGDRVLATRSLGEGDEAFSLTVPVAPGDVQGGFLPIRFDYSGANTERVCFDERMSGDFLSVTAQSGLRLTMAPGQVEGSALFAALKPARTVIELPEAPGLADMAALVRAAALLNAEQGALRIGAPQATGQEATGQDWDEAQIRIRAAADGPVSAMTVEVEEARPELTVSGTDPQVGLAQLLSPWAGLSGLDRTTTRAAAWPVASGDRLPLAALGGDLASRAVKASEDVTVGFSVSDIPAGKVVSDLHLVAIAGLDPEGDGATISVFLNDVLLGSRSLQSGDPQRLSFAVPQGLVGGDNTLRFHLQRRPAAGACRYTMQGYPVQILPGSALLLAEGSGGTDDFFDLRQAAGPGVQLVIDRDLSQPLTQVAPWLAGVAGSILPDGAIVVPRADMAAVQGDMPFILVSDTNPGGADPAVRMDAGRIEIRDTSGALLFDGDGLSRLGIVQLVTVNGTTGLWLKPGQGPAPVWTEAAPLRLDRGDLAFLDDSGLVLATATRTGALVDIDYPDATRLGDILERYRVWIIGGLWLLLTLVVLGVFQRLYRRRGRPAGQDD